MSGSLARTDDVRGPALFFLHIHKTTGMTLHRVIERKIVPAVSPTLRQNWR
jgi:hypothetical protein